MASEGEKRKLVDLRVVDLRAELEKRGLENKGVKATLIERLQKVLREEGHDPEEYSFEIESAKTPKRPSMKRGEQDTESETQSNADENHDTTMEVDEESKEKDEEEEDEKVENGKENETKGSLEKSLKQEEKKEPASEKSTASKSEEKSEEKHEGSSVLASARTGTDTDKSVPEANGVDNEDSINLTIGEDEEKLLADEVGHEEDSSSQEKEVKDEGERGGENPEEGTAGGDGKKQAAGQEEDKDTAGEDNKQEKAQEENRDDKGGDKGKSSLSIADQKPSKDDKDKRTKPAATAGSSRNLWVSGLSSSTRATDLKQVFSKYGKVIGAKVVTNARTPGARCYGYVTMATSEDASKCIQHLHRTELHGRMISVERAKGDSAGPPKKGIDGRAVAGKKVDEKKKHERKLSSSSKTEEKKSEKEEKAEGGKAETGKAEATKEEAKAEDEEETKDKEATGESGEKEKEGSEPDKEGDEHNRSTDKPHSRDVSDERRERHRSAGSSHYSHHSRPTSRSPHRRVFRPGSPGRRPGVLTFTQIREERERQRLRERERELREEDRRRREEMARQREIERRQREEAVRLEREKERLRVERERIEAERAELMRLERERQRLEREKLEREREELKRQQMRSQLVSAVSQQTSVQERFEEARRTTKRPTDDRRDSYGEDRKRVATERRYEGSQTARFEENARSNDFQGKKEYKHGGDFAGRRTAGGKFEGTNYDQDNRTPRGEGMVMKKDPSHELPRRDHTVQDVGRGKDGRFERGPSFRVREERRPESDHRPKVDMRHSARERYPDSAKGEGRYSERSGESWHAGGGPPPVKPFSSLSGSGVPSRDSWGASGERKSDGGQSWGRPMESGSSDRWVSGGSGPMGAVGRSGPSMGPGSMYTSQQNVPPNPPGMNMGMSSSGPYGTDRFDSYKQSMGPIRKY